MNAGTATVSGAAPADTTSVLAEWTDQDGKQRQKYVTVTDGEYAALLTGLPIGTTPVSLTAFNGDQEIASTTVDVKLEVVPVTATATFAEDVRTVAQVSGTAQPNTKVTIKHGEKDLVTVPTDADGKWTTPVNAPNMPGVYNLTVGQEIRGADNGRVDLDIDYGAGVTVTSPGNDFVLDPGDTLAIKGNAPSGTEISVHEKGKTEVLGTARAGSSNSYLVPIAGLEDREYTLVAEGITKGYNRTRAELVVNPGKSTVQDPTGEVVFDADVTKKATVEGTGADGATITVKNGTKTLGTATVQDGSWSLPIDPIGPGKHTLTIEQTGIEGTQTATTEADFGAAIAISTPAAGKVSPGKVPVTGTGENGAAVTVRAGSETATTTVENGTWSTEIEIPASTDAVEITVEQLSKGSLTTSASTTVTADGPQEARDVVITEPSSHTYKPNRETTVRGTATPYATIDLRFQWNDTVYGSAKADVNGNWSITRAYGPAAKYELTATQTRFDTTTSASTTFTLNPEGITDQEAVITGPSDHTYKVGQQTRITGTATPYAKIELRFQWNDTVYGRAVADAEGNWNVVREFGPSAIYEITAKQIRADDTTSFSDTFTISPEGAVRPLSLTTPAMSSTFQPGVDVFFSGTGDPGAKITAIAPAWNDGKIFETTVKPDGNWEIRRQFAGIPYDLTIVQEPVDGEPSYITGIHLTPID